MANNLGGYWKLAEVLKGLIKTESKTRGTATVRDVDGEGTVWVVPIGTDEAVPVTGVNVASVSIGDVVTIETDGGKVSVVGNATEPAVGQVTVNATVNLAVDAVRDGVTRLVNAVSDVADEAKAVAEATNQHFFTDSNGIHVTEATQEDWESDHTGANVLINSLGQLFRNGLNNLVSITSSATQFYDGVANAAANVVAQFGSFGAIIGKVAAAHISITNSLIDIFGSDGSTPVLSLSGTTSTSTSAYMSMLGGQGVVHTYQDASGQIHLVLTTGDEVSVNPSYRMAEIKMSDAVESGGTYGAPQIDMTGKVSISDDLTLGTQLGISNGGTGLTSSPSMLVNLGSTSAESVLQATPRPGVTGTLGAAHGGTGQTSLQATRNAMGLGDTTGALPVANGGTGKTTAADARGALGAAARSWTQLDTSTNDTAMTYDLSNYYEVMFVARASTNYVGSVVLPKAQLSTTAREVYLSGGSNSSTGGRGFAVTATSTKATPAARKVDGTTTSCTWWTYAR